MKTPCTMNFNELKSWLSDRLQHRSGALADISMRRDEAPFEKPAMLWKSGSEEFRSNFKRAILDLIDEAAAKPWDATHFHELCRLIETADLWEAVRPLESAAQSGRLLRGGQGKQLQMLALRTLLGLNWKGSRDFWLAQKEKVGEQWPSIIFVGIAQHNLDEAMGQLPELVHTRDAMLEILNHCPGLMRELRLGLSSLRDKCQQVMGKLNPEAAQAMQEWFRLEKCPLGTPRQQVSSTLFHAVQVLLNNHKEDPQPKFNSPFLCAA